MYVTKKDYRNEVNDSHVPIAIAEIFQISLQIYILILCKNPVGYLRKLYDVFVTKFYDNLRTD